MKIFCPACGRQYTIDDAKIPPKGLLVKCSVCGAEFRAKKEAAPVPSPESATALPAGPDAAASVVGGEKNADTLDDLFNDLTSSEKPAVPPPASLDMDALHKKYSEAPIEESPDAPLLKEQPPVKRSGSATIPSAPLDEAAEPPIERNEDYAARPAEPPSSPAGAPAPVPAAVAPAQKDILDSLFDDLGGGPASEQEKTVNMNLAELSSPVAAPKKPEAPPVPPVPPIPTRAEKRVEEKQTRAPEGIGGGGPDALSDLFSDMRGDDIEKKIIEKSVMLGVGEEEGGVETPASREIYIRKRQTNEVLGPFPEKALADMVGRKEVNRNDFISYDGIRWEPIRDLGAEVLGQTITSSSESGPGEPGLRDMGEMPRGGMKLSLSEDVRADQPAAPSLFNDTIATFEDETIQKRDAVEHTMIPDVPGGLPDTTSPGAEDAPSVRRRKKKKKRKNEGLLFAFKIAAVLVVVSVAAGSAAWWYKHRKPKADVLDRISETFTEATGTLTDVRAALLRDTRQDYLRSLGILKPYLRGDDIPPAVAGLDAQVKVLLLLSYKKKTEPIEAVADRVDLLRRKNPDDPDLTKALAFLAIEKGDADRAVSLLEKSDKSDPDVLYVFGLAAKLRKDLKQAEGFFYTGYTNAEGKSNRLAFEMVQVYMEQGDIDSAIAYLNKTISASPYYLKGYLKKAEILAYEKQEYDEAIRFLASVDAAILSQADESEKARYYAVLGDLNYRKGSAVEAVENYKRAVAIEKENVDYLAVLAKIYQETGQAALALEHYEKVLAVDNRHIPSIIGKAEIFVRLKKYNEAFLEIAKVDIDNLADAGQLLRLGNLYFRQNEREKALQLYERAIKKEPGLVEAYLGRVFIYLETGMYDEIRKIVDNIGTLDKESYSYYLIKGILAHADGEYKKANEHFRRAIELNRAEDPRAFFFYGRFMYDRENYAAAADLFTRAMKQSPDDPEYRIALAQALDRQKQYQEVLAVLEPVGGNQKVHAKAFQLRAEALFRTDRSEEALKQIEEAIKLDAKNPFFFYKKGELLYAREDYQAATVTVETALMLDIKHFDSYVLFAKILLRKGDFKTAVEKLEEAERIDANNQQVFLLKGILYKNLDNYPEALRNFRRIKKNPELEKEALLEIGECYLNLERTNEALKYFTKAAQAGNKGGYRFLARIYYDRNSLDKATQYYQQTLKAFPDDPEPIKQLGYIAKERQKYTKARSYFKRYLGYLKPGDPERKMIEDEIFYSEKNIGGSKLAKIRREEKEEDDLDAREKGADEFADEADADEAKQLYMEAVSLVETDRKEAQKLLRRILSKAPSSNRYFIKARKLLKKMKEEEEEI